MLGRMLCSAVPHCCIVRTTSRSSAAARVQGVRMSNVYDVFEIHIILWRCYYTRHTIITQWIGTKFILYVYTDHYKTCNVNTVCTVTIYHIISNYSMITLITQTTQSSRVFESLLCICNIHHLMILSLHSSHDHHKVDRSSARIICVHWFLIMYIIYIIYIKLQLIVSLFCYHTIITKWIGPLLVSYMCTDHYNVYDVYDVCTM